MLRRSFFSGWRIVGGLRGQPAPCGGMQRPGRRAEVDRLRCVKHERKLYAYRDDEVVMTFNVALGREPRGHKVQEGDGRTPRAATTSLRRDTTATFICRSKSPTPMPKTGRGRARLGVSPGGQIMLHGLDPAIGPSGTTGTGCSTGPTVALR
jgi:hypothetical protein